MNLLKSKISILLFLSALIFSCQEEGISPKSPYEQTVSESPVSSDKNNNQDAKYGRDNNLLMGNPSGANSNSYYYWNYLISKPQYAMSYHRDRGTPNWVSWHLNEDWLGSASRSTSFVTDTSLPSGWYRVSSSDYTNSGFDRGHNCPSADRTGSSGDNKATFYMSNIIPQAPNNNQRVWANLESYCRKLVDQGNELYVIMGSYGKGGSGRYGYKSTLAGGKVTVPAYIWKVILVLPEGYNDLNRVSSSTRVIAVNIPNNQDIGSNWGDYRTSVDNIESIRNYDLFSNLSGSIQSTIESRVDNGPTN
ncbi:DNA/RNA non-specific endonuclease [Fulvivirga sp. 29W222]|uniref:DNA/RNA non-specific endonuclease n=1 Tax=Fulvivirga marina TaxID=2494733 RepID=A0A937KAQ8_9BACT|nr:DNA/RNA non-specific endonuclease [Fulvivirga marina]MBL6444784.1 DNA/RNA non-specific endonuclease [Fulvivirga marina]